MVQKQPRQRLLATALILITLILGGLAGATLDRALNRSVMAEEVSVRDDVQRSRPGHGPRSRHRTRYIDQLTNELDLTDEQRARVEILLKGQQDRIRELRQETRRQSSRIVRETREEIMELLTAEQRKELRQMRRARD